MLPQARNCDGIPSTLSNRTYAVEGFGEARLPQMTPISRCIGGEAADTAGKDIWRGTQRVPGPPNLPLERLLRKSC
jgi:hypothetical protein